MRDRLAAKLSSAVGEVDAAELWDADGAHSMISWLRHHAGLAGPDAHRMVSTSDGRVYISRPPPRE